MGVAYVLVLTLLGLALLAGAILPRLLRSEKVPLPMVYLGTGILVAHFWTGAPRIDPIEQGFAIEHLAELAVIVSLTGAGLKLDRELGWRSWGSTWRLLAIAMPLCIVAVAAGGVWLAGLPLAAAVLLGAATAPTDPVLAASVQVGPPGEPGEEHEVRFALTSEAGLNDGLAFPFVNLGILLAVAGATASGLLEWLTIDLLWKIGAGVLAGLLIGRGIARLALRLSPPSAVGDGFLAVFVAALTFRRTEKNHDDHDALHDFTEQVEQILMAALLLALGAAIAQGLLHDLGWKSAALALGFLLVVRPLAGMLALSGTGLPTKDRLAIATLGIRGLGSVYYLAHGLNQCELEPAVARDLWAIVGAIVLASVVLHVLAAPQIMKRID